MLYKIPAVAARKVINFAETLGVSSGDICDAVKLDSSRLIDPDNQILFEQLVRLYQYAALLSGDQNFGLHVGEQSNPKTYELLGYIVMNSETFSDFLNSLLRYQHIWTDAVSFSLKTTASNIHLSYIYRVTGLSAEERRQESENMLSVIMKVGRLVMEVNWMPIETHFEHKQPFDISEHKRIFGESVYFNKPHTKVIFDSSVMELPIMGADSKLCELLRRHAEDLLPKSQLNGAITNRVREVLSVSLTGGSPFAIEIISKKIGVSSRTLQRKLREGGTSYHKLVEDVQRDLSERYLQSSEMSICELSYILGFSQQSAFHRAFRRWTGMTPKEFRRAHRG